jgi:hypothetical protein
MGTCLTKEKFAGNPAAQEYFQLLSAGIRGKE